ncbi:LysM peptidoglycan-binding domain-containing protein [Ruegeria sp. R13_0]|uniref:LysM peptidoglycan-binding domain-containing protein n=1 Tax=Ruegeria sp. R13_0 TaxID=2821099 RepID=UPI001AD9EE16|nr:LysM peptidoglycan-binding domain-containing protein [Ruegeria sp. R13_0]MBO9435480.1 LysM peptidoglycan-binding domain-containing protein [Ruegeria sp. R13_0]
MNGTSGSGSSGSFIWGLLVGLVAILAAGGLYLSGVFSSSPEPVQEQVEVAEETRVPEVAPEEEASQDPAPAPKEAVTEAEAEEPAAEDPEAQPEEVAVEAAPTAPPALDQIFVSPDGSALLSGEAEPGSDIDVVLNGEVVHQFSVDETGQFAEFVAVPFSDDPRGLVLQSTDGSETVRSDDYLIAALPEPAPEEPAPTAEEAPSEPEVAEDPQPEAEDTIVASVDPEQPTETADAGKEASDASTETAQAGTEETAELDTDTADTGTEAGDTVTETADAGAEAQNTGADTEEAVAEAESAPEEETETPAENQQVAILRSGEDGVELVQSPSEENSAPQQVELDTIGYSDSGDVQLTGRLNEGSAVRIYLNNRLVADVTPQEDGNWRGDLEGIDPGVYTLRVDEVHSDGTVLSRVETPFKREPVEVLQAAEAQTSEQPQETPAPIRSVTVQAGDTLWAISRERFGDGVLYVRLFDANRELIRDPDLIFPGQVFTIPE